MIEKKSVRIEKHFRVFQGYLKNFKVFLFYFILIFYETVRVSLCFKLF